MNLQLIPTLILFCIHNFVIKCNEFNNEKCINCVSPKINNIYYDALINLFNNISKSNFDTFKNNLVQENKSIINYCNSNRENKSNNAQSSKFDNGKFSDFIFKLTYVINMPFCSPNVISKYNYGDKAWKMWTVGLISVTIINGCAALGLLFVPLMKRKSYKFVLTFMIAMAVGSLSGSALLILIPDSFELLDLQSSSSNSKVDYRWKATVIFGGVYMFFLVERFLKWITNRKGRTLSKKLTQHCGSMNVDRSQTHIFEIEPNFIGEEHTRLNGDSNTLKNNLSLNGEKIIDVDLKEDSKNTEVDVLVVNSKKIAPVAWMIIFGDALHNFIDGLSIGAAFSENIFKGISLSLAVLCEELPHELGDFAILLNAGMTVKVALLWNLLSASTCYLGFIVGVILGELTSSSQWIFALAGGMFLYISLVDMMPELNAILEDPENRKFGHLQIFIIQNLGLLFGYSIILIMSFFGDHIKIQ